MHYFSEFTSVYLNITDHHRHLDNYSIVLKDCVPIIPSSLLTHR